MESNIHQHPLRYNFAQAFGERDPDQGVFIQEADMISAVRFNERGDMIATGDRGGRIVLLRRVDQPKSSARRTGRRKKALLRAAQNKKEEARNGTSNPDVRESARNLDPPEFRFWTQFQSHEPEFDYLKSMEIEERINQIRWVRQVNGARRLISSNDKTIKLWRISERDMKAVASFSCDSLLSADSKGQPNSYLQLPSLQTAGSLVSATPKRIFSSAHAYHINSISMNSDDEVFLSADDLRVNLWNLNAGGVGFNILDIKPDNMEDLTEVITSAEFHPQHCNLFIHSSSRGVVKLVDLRQSALCEGWAREFEEPEDHGSSQSFFSEIIASISDIKFSPDGRYILTRDYMTLRLWDVNMERTPVLVIPVHEHLRARLSDLYENDCIFDKFQCDFSYDGGSIVTGSYNALFQTYSSHNGAASALEASVDFVSGTSGRRHLSAEALAASLIAGASAQELVDPTRRVMQVHTSPKNNIAAVATGPALYVYYS
uniref:Serine/threonine-protein phosphatase 2A 55 kDa regulatory subunit B n=1 Tax=Timspurckia oligopyrenoides TaxID=708627 RepID=A0A7S0ZFF0_9RHOD|mmetsp:Transcript_3235/g.5686  ORF Transcript_3235/g.5686 Transcript_3235/m.5686 type:complete len:488 (+) Transcript_3235:483-1946(+)|eukprot:CAMPEP_0182447156 /NCGR_PEP_ID=MMETSP1172-20130603/12172_1 /TAXON_ID=708627 /ORGANISM="Timspurckia oligopyrenoides, Strain CCMP3278" /LENGTH=487 /DNA_ID=CAMNT_0024643483 /DNA_START=409 /DNA_END=1872 /DNA_ORIENTATION=+